MIWLLDPPARPFNKAAVQKYRAELETKGLAPSSINVRLSAVRRLAIEAADNGLISLELAAGICRARGARQAGVRLGHWLTKEQAERLLAIPDQQTIKGIRDRAVLALLVGAGLRRSELASLNCEHIQKRDGRWLIADLIGKQGRVRTVPLPDWARSANIVWQEAARIESGALFRRVTRHGRVSPSRLSPQAVFEIVRKSAGKLGMIIRPHDLRRTFAKLAYIGHSPLEQIQFSLGHASVVTTELYIGTKQDLQDAPCDRLGLSSVVHDSTRAANLSDVATISAEGETNSATSAGNISLTATT